ncbi:MAG: sigma-70 family RNA polymerase sigma factor [Actinobacteria bacterium]|nr:MAG: sigma-70 family RNA polymerase sigma factor [Actinomycetota bacterium]TMK19443.1 MAG: sigma-70 family RNA polymerase sigma factor [Actinomycetota bacterium]TMM22546.1 MAG: sigma-70 family RNA polymerase sigma factor [Actinomycetota bacterium]
MTAAMQGRSVASGMVEDLSAARDRQLVRRIEGGDEEAFRSLFASYAPVAMALAVRVVRQTQLAEEIVQEAFLTLWRDPGVFDERRGSVKAWLMTMVHHRAVDVVRREEAQRRRSHEMVARIHEETEDPTEAVVEAVAAPAERDAIRTALRSLPDDQREVLQLMYFDGLSQSQIAQKTGAPLGTVKSRALLGMRRMRSMVERPDR